jgi:hypothetical protein
MINDQVQATFDSKALRKGRLYLNIFRKRDGRLQSAAPVRFVMEHRGVCA